MSDHDKSDESYSNDDESYDNDDFYFDDDYDTDDDSFAKHVLPTIVEKELERRRKRNGYESDVYLPSPLIAGVEEEGEEPASQDIMDAFHDHVKAGLFKPEIEGGYIDLMKVSNSMLFSPEETFSHSRYTNRVFRCWDTLPSLPIPTPKTSNPTNGYCV